MGTSGLVFAAWIQRLGFGRDVFFRGGEGWMDGWMDGGRDGWMDGWMDIRYILLMVQKS